MISSLLVGKVFKPVHQTLINNVQRYVLVVTTSISSKEYAYMDCFVSDYQQKLLENIKAGDLVILSGELSISAFIAQDGKSKVKLTLFTKNIKLTTSNLPNN